MGRGYFTGLCVHKGEVTFPVMSLCNSTFGIEMTKGLFATLTIVIIVSRSRDAAIIIYSIITQCCRNSERKSTTFVTIVITS